MPDPAEFFARQKYVVRPLCVKEPDLSMLYKYLCHRADSGTMITDPRSPGAWAAPGDVFTDSLLVDLMPLAEDTVGLKLFPTYSYFRVYRRGDILVKHTDRDACEISVSICLGYEGTATWPLFLQSSDGIMSIELAPGDALFYRGIEFPHWREPLDGDRAVQLFLHYVDQNGRYADWKYNKRKELPFSKLIPSG